MVKLGMSGPLGHLYASAKWRRIRRIQLLAEPLCRLCAQRGIVTPADVVDHVIPHGGNVNNFWLNPLQSLCKSCHDAGKRFEDLHGYQRDIGLDGMPIDPRHPANQRRRQVR
jgi:5-methylcytosine-specific restriction enzyme A